MPENSTTSTTAAPVEDGQGGATPQQPTAAEQASPADTGDEAALRDAGKKAIDAMKAERNAANSRVKALERELAAAKTAAMTDAERAVADAEARGRSAVLAEVGQKLARARFDALAGRRNANADTAKVLEFVDLRRFVGDDGELDEKAIAAAVERLVPAPPAGPPSFDGGARSTASAPTDMNALIRRQLGART